MQGKVPQELEVFIKPCVNSGFHPFTINRACFEGSVPFNNTMIFQHAELGVKAHVKVIETWKELRDCVGEARKQGNVCAKAEDLLTLVRKYVTEVIQSGVGAVHDTPYTMMIPYILKVARETRGTGANLAIDGTKSTRMGSTTSADSMN